ncbi:A-agglutinin anchorage subunit-like [Haliotis rufescens]|uniref:A-agglutinin anchorage subunit-like n=1 Tax=Haliotis rufescens TaxID=6454 RepID=UPI00201E835C|nr:A-agglutinin anchorage subunit-like [Haliotis rufescens]
MQCDGVITHHFLIGGRNATFPKVYLKRLGVVDKLQCFLHCSQYTGCRRVGVSTVGECFLFAESNRTLPDESINTGYLYSSLVAGLTTQEQNSTISDARQRSTSSMNTRQQTMRATEAHSSSSSSSSSSNPVSPATANTETTTTSKSSNTSNGTEDRTPDITHSKAITPSSNSSTEDRTSDIRQSKATTHASITSTGPDLSGSQATTPPRPSPGDAFIKSVYTIVTQTGTEKDSGTACFVYVDLYGETGGKETLYLDNPGDEMSEGSNDTFTFIRSSDLGNFTKMVLRVGKFGLRPGWLVVGVEVGRKRTYERHETTDIYYTYINQWFQRMDGWHFFEFAETKFVMNYTMMSTFTTEY